MKVRVLLRLIVFCMGIMLFGGCGDDDSPASSNGDGGTPAISMILPPGAGPGIQMTVSGSKFGTEQGTGIVQVGGQDASVDSWSETEIIFAVPDRLTESQGVSVKVTTDIGKSTTWQIDVTLPNTYKVTSDHAMDHYPCWSPNGDYIYFSSTRSGDANWDIYRVPALGGEAERITYDDSPDFYPDMNPSSGELAWSSKQKHINNSDGDYEIFYGFPHCIGPGSSCTMTMLTDNKSRDLDPAYANTVYSGYSMVYTWEEVDQSGSFLAWKVMLHSTGPPVELTEGRQPNFSSNGQWVVYTLDDNIYKIPTGGGIRVQLTDLNCDWYPHWGWANDKIVFQRLNSGNFEDIFVMNSDGTDIQPLISTRSSEYCPSWSPDCTKIAYYAQVWGSFDIYVYVVP